MVFAAHAVPCAIACGESLSSRSTIAAIMEDPIGAAIVNRYLPGFADNEQIKQAYGMTFKALAPMLGLPENVLNALLEDLDKL